MDAQVRVDWHDGAAKRLAREAGQAACELFGDSIQKAAQKIVPHKEGTLEGSGMTEPVKSGIGVRISFGGPAEMYAAVQHEDEGLSHAPGRQAKYLQTPFQEAAPRFPRFAELFVKTALKAGSVSAARGIAIGGGS